MRGLRGYLVAFSLLVLATQSHALPKEAATCVQHQLIALNYNPGTLDGWIGPSTRAAAERWRLDQAADKANLYPDLTQRTALQWCRQLGEDNEELQQYWPSKKNVRFLTDEDGQDYKTDLLRAALAEAQKYFETEYQIRLAGSFHLTGSDDIVKLENHIADARKTRHINLLYAPLDPDRNCSDDTVLAVAFRNIVAMCWFPTEFQSISQWTKDQNGTFSVMVHEYMHLIQYELSNDVPEQKMPRTNDWLLGPNWMAEGTAEFLEEAYVVGWQNGTAYGNYKMFKIVDRHGIPLRTLGPDGSIKSSLEYRVSHFAAELLARRSGPESLFTYWRNLGKYQNQERAFQETFGMGLIEFETRFETLRHDYLLSQKFATGKVD